VKGFYISFKSTTEAREAFYPVVRIGSPLNCKRVLSLPNEGGGGEPIFLTMGHTLWYSKYTITIIP
jgi:hypothetical protein